MKGTINITGDIGSYKDRAGNSVKGVDLMDVVIQYEKQKETCTSFDVIIDSLGGFCDVGYDIYAYLKTIPVPVTTIAVNRCASIATVIFLAGSIRKALCNLMIHNPWMGGVEGDADVFEAAAADIRAEEDKLINLYHKETGASKIALDALMKNETYISPEEALILKFATHGAEASENISLNSYKAVARMTEKNNMSKDTKDLSAKIDEALTLIKNFLKGDNKRAKALKVMEQGGKSIDITNADGTDITGVPVAGNMAMIDGAPAPDGEYVIPDLNISITVAAGVVSNVTDSSQASTDQKLAAALKEVEDLKKERDETKKALDENKKDTDAAKAKLEEIEVMLKAMSGKPIEGTEAKNQFREIGKESSVDEIKKANEERKKEYSK